MDCFQINWQGEYHCTQPHDLPVSKRSAIYALYKRNEDIIFGDNKDLLYIGQSSKSHERLYDEIQGLSRGMTDDELNQRILYIGVISSFDDEFSPITPEQLDAIELFFIRKYKPSRNKAGVMGKPKHLPLLIINTGKELFEPVISHNETLIKLLKDNLCDKSILDF